MRRWWGEAHSYPIHYAFNAKSLKSSQCARGGTLRLVNDFILDLIAGITHDFFSLVASTYTFCVNGRGRPLPRLRALSQVCNLVDSTPSIRVRIWRTESGGKRARMGPGAKRRPSNVRRRDSSINIVLSEDKRLNYVFAQKLIINLE